MKKRKILLLVECGIMVALAVVLDVICGLIPGFRWFWGYGGSISIGMLPLVFISFRHGWRCGGACALVYAAMQMLLGFYAPPVQSIWYFVLCILLDYVIGFGVLGIADAFAKLFAKRKLLGYGVATAAVCVLRFASSFLSGLLVFNSNFYVEAGQSTPSLIDAISDSGAWIYSLTYNGSYMLANAIINPILIVILCAAIDPLTLKKYKK